MILQHTVLVRIPENFIKFLWKEGFKPSKDFLTWKKPCKIVTYKGKKVREYAKITIRPFTKPKFLLELVGVDITYGVWCSVACNSYRELISNYRVI